MNRIDCYIFRQLAGGLLAVTTGLAALVWLTQSLRFIELVLDRGLSLAVFLELTSLMLPGFVVVILPITTFIVVLFVFVRMNTDRELVVMRAAGLSPLTLARPAITISFGEIIRLIEGPLALVPCVSVSAYQRCADCFEESTCVIRKTMLIVRDNTAAILDNTSLADLSVDREAA